MKHFFSEFENFKVRIYSKIKVFSQNAQQVHSPNFSNSRNRESSSNVMGGDVKITEFNQIF